MSIFIKISDFINEVIKKICFLLLVAMTVIIVIQVFYRYVIGSSLSWSEEIARYIFIWIIMLGASTGVKESFHVAVTAFIGWLPENIRSIISTINVVMLGLVGLIMVFYGYNLSELVAVQLSPAIRLSMFWVYLSVPVSGLLIIVHVLSKLQDLLTELFYAGK